MLLQLQQQFQESPKPKITDEEALIWCYKNANSECINANNALEIIVNLCSCSAKDIDLAKVIRSQIDFVSDQLSHKTYQSLIHNTTNDSNATNAITTDEEVVKTVASKTETLREIQNLLLKKFRLLSLLRMELTNCRCECQCADKSSTGNVANHLRKSESNCKMWFRQIRVIETKIECNRLSVPFDAIKVVRQLLLNSNELNIDSMSVMPISLDFDNNSNNDFKSNNSIKTEKLGLNDDSSNDLVANDCSYGSVCYTNSEFENDNSYDDSSLKNMQILRFDSLLQTVSEENSLTLEPNVGNDMTNTTNTEMDCEVRTFQELHPISCNSSNVGLNYSAHEISLMRSNAVLHHEFDYRTDTDLTNANNFADDILPQITAIEIDQLLNN